MTIMNVAHPVDLSLMPIGEILRVKGLLSESDLDKGLRLQQEIGGLLGQALHRIGAVTEEALIQCLSEQLGYDIIGIADLPTDRQVFHQSATLLDIPADWFIENRAAIWIAADRALMGEKGPFGSGTSEMQSDPSAEVHDRQPRDDIMYVIAADPLSAPLREMIEGSLDAVLSAREGGPSPHNAPSIRYHLADNQTIDAAIAYYRNLPDEDEDSLGDASRLRELAEEAPVIDFVNNMFANSLKAKASDIHIEAGNPVCLVRFRIDGVMHERSQIGQTHFDAVASRIKLISGMDIAERRLPQDGRCTIRFAGHEVDLRVSSVPSTWGESIVIRLLRKQTELPDLSGLGLIGRTRAVLERILSLPNGVFLVTGPTGSGKSTTLYRGLETINDGQRKIITIEDPVEYDVDGITQIQVKSEIGYDFASGLRAVLRQDPDVIMVGEIRDQETANIAAQAALTGHLVLSTLHTNSALAAITRLRDIGLESYLIASSVRGFMAQRLVRKLCADCSEPISSDRYDEAIVEAEKLYQKLPISAQTNPENWLEARGCEKCAHTGYSGRIALSEVVEIDDELREAIAQDKSMSQILELARKQDFLTLYEDGILKARNGDTTLAEVLRVCSGDYV